MENSMFSKRTMTNVHELKLPPELDLALYKTLHSDVASMDDVQLERHYKEHECVEGRQPNALRTGNDFVNLIPSSAKILEIGPFCVPLLRGPAVSYFDVMDKEHLIERARTLGWPHTDCPDSKLRFIVGRPCNCANDV
jgi:hypothetical protein